MLKKMKNEKYLTKKEEVEARIKEIKDSDPLFKKKQQILSEIVSKYRKFIYVDPNTFKGLVNHKQNKLVDHSYAEKKAESSDSYFIYTNHVKAPKFADKFIEFDENTAMMIKQLDWAFCDKLFAEITKSPYNKRKGILKIENSEIDFAFSKDTGKICNLLFGSAQYVKRKHKWSEVLTKALDREKAGNLENAMKLKVHRMNERILEEIGYRDLIKFEDKALFVNPDYLYLFKTPPNETV